MDNIYVQTPFERNSIVTLPEGYASSAGNTLYSWLGSLWHGLNKGDGMVRGLQAARGVRLAQLYLNILEALKLQDRNGAPVFHRELWHPIVIRRSEVDSSQENMLFIGMDADIGPQPEGSVYGEGTVLEMGKLANYEDYVTYPIPDGIVGMNSTIVDNIINPTVVMSYDMKDFECRGGAIIFPKEHDPLAAGSPFEKYDVPGFDPDHPERSDMEAVLWASDVLIDKNYISDHVSYALGVSAPSTDVAKRVVNSAWSSVACGLTPELIRTLIASILNVPVIQNDTETITDIQSGADVQMVYTDKGAYKVSPKARLVKGLHPGVVLKRGDLLDESLRIYPYLNNISEQPFSVPIEQDIPSVVLPPGMLTAKTEYGIFATWGTSEVRRSETSPLDANGNPHLYFDVGGTAGDASRFWEDVWKRFEDAGVSMETVLTEGGRVSPAEFFLKNLTGANTIYVVIDRSQLDDVSLMRNPMFFGMINSVIPSAVRLFLVEHRSTDNEEEMDLGVTSRDGAFMSAAMPAVVDHVAIGSSGASYEDRVSVRFVRPAPKRVKAKKEEE